MDSSRSHPDTASVLKFVVIFPIMPESLWEEGHCLMMDATCLRDAMALIGRHVWEIDLVGTCQSDGCGGGKQAKNDLTCGAAEQVGVTQRLMQLQKSQPS